MKHQIYRIQKAPSVQQCPSPVLHTVPKFLRDERPHPVRQMFALDKVPNAKPEKNKRKLSDHAAINNFLPIFLPGIHKLQSIVCII